MSDKPGDYNCEESSLELISPAYQPWYIVFLTTKQHQPTYQPQKPSAEQLFQLTLIPSSSKYCRRYLWLIGLLLKATTVEKPETSTNLGSVSLSKR